MSQIGYTPIQLYYSTTATNVPLATDLVYGELALNAADGKLYYKDSATNTVKLLASNSATTNVSTISFGTTGLTPATATSGAVTVAGTLVVSNGGTGLTTLGTGYIPYGNGTSAFGSSASFYYSSNVLYTPSASLSGNLTFTGTGNRILGDFSNATLANRVAFQTSTTNGVTTGISLPNGTGTASGWRYYNNSDVNNASFTVLYTDSSKTSLESSISGTGSYLPMTFYTGGSERMRIATDGKVGIGTASAAVTLAINGLDAVLVPKGATGDRPSGVAGYLRFNTSTSSFEGYNGTAWGSIGGGATGGGGDQVFYLNGQTVTTSYSIPSGQNAMSTGTLTINAGVTVTVPSGSRWVVL
jgi:hypothetical protein